jgi:hypothetical protein
MTDERLIGILVLKRRSGPPQLIRWIPSTGSLALLTVLYRTPLLEEVDEVEAGVGVHSRVGPITFRCCYRCHRCLSRKVYSVRAVAEPEAELTKLNSRRAQNGVRLRLRASAHGEICWALRGIGIPSVFRLRMAESMRRTV